MNPAGVAAVKLFLVPGSIPFLWLGLAGGIALLYAGKRAHRWARAWLTGLLAFYAVLSTPAGSDLVAARLSGRFAPITRPSDLERLDTIVVLSNGGDVYRAAGLEVAEMGRLTSFSAMEAARLYRMLGGKATIVPSGGIVNPGHRKRPEAEVLADGLAGLGVPRSQLVLEVQSRTTHEQAVYSAEILRRRRTSRFVLVTTAAHMPRAEASFRAQGLDPVPSPSVPVLATAPGWLHRLRPNVGALQQSDWACYEHLARLYYRARGWGR